MTTCVCYQPPFNFKNYVIKELGYDKDYGDISIATCQTCGNQWLNYLVEEEHISRSGRWWRVLLDKPDITVNEAKGYIESRPWHFGGGSYYDSTGKRRDFSARIF
jgi:hypothetical protein